MTIGWQVIVLTEWSGWDQDHGNVTHHWLLRHLTHLWPRGWLGVRSECRAPWSCWLSLGTPRPRCHTRTWLPRSGGCSPQPQSPRPTRTCQGRRLWACCPAPTCTRPSCPWPGRPWPPPRRGWPPCSQAPPPTAAAPRPRTTSKLRSQQRETSIQSSFLAFLLFTTELLLVHRQCLNREFMVQNSNWSFYSRPLLSASHCTLLTKDVILD